MWLTVPVHLAVVFCGFFLSYSCAQKSCFMEDWSSKFKKNDETSCESGNGYYNIVGFERDGTDNLQGIKKAKCCERDQTFWNQPTQCQMPDWSTSLDGTGTSNCQQGFFLRGLYRSNGNNVGNLEWGKCCKPSHHPYHWGDCYDEDVSSTFNKAGLSQCNRDGYFIAGLRSQASRGKLSSIKKFKCCRMVEEIPELQTMDELKQRVMDATMSNLGQLASMMGFAWSGGCWASDAGDDFRRNGGAWQSTYRSNWCIGNGPKKDVRLKITYENFAFTMKDVKFGKSITQSIPLDKEKDLMNAPDRSYSKVVSNRKDSKTSSTVQVQIRSARTLENVKRSSWDANIGIEVGLEYEPPSTTGGVGFSAKTNFKYEWGGEEEETTADQDWHIFLMTDKKELPPNTFSEWHAFKKPQKVTIPYVAVIIPTFTVKLEGFMTHGGGYHGKYPNFHQEHRGSGDRQNIEYIFGTAEKPFYEDLEEQIEQNKYPWQWHALKQHYPYAKYYIDQLINKDLYAFTMAGQFEESTENEVKSTWYPSKPIDQMEDALAKMRAQEDQAAKPVEFPRVLPPPPKVQIINNSKEIHIPPNKHFNDNDRDAEYEFPRIHPPPPKVKPIDNKKEMKPPPVKHYSD